MRIHNFGKLSLMDKFGGGIEEGVLYLRSSLPIKKFLIRFG